MTVLTFSHSELLAACCVPVLVLSHSELLATPASGLLMPKAPHCLMRHLRRAEPSTVRTPVCGRAHESRSSTAAMAVTATAKARERGRTPASAVAMATPAGECRSTATGVRSTAASAVAATTTGSRGGTTTAMRPSTAATSSVATAMFAGTRICRGGDRQRSSTRGEKHPGHHG